MSHHALSAPTTRPLTGGKVLMILLGFFGLMAVANAILVTAALKTWSGLDEASPYQAGRRYNAELASVRAQEALGWSVEVQVVRDGADGALVSADIRDRSGKPVRGLSTRGALERPIDKRLDLPVALEPAAPGQYRTHLDHVPAGQWDLVLDLGQDGERLYRRQLRVLLP